MMTTTNEAGNSYLHPALTNAETSEYTQGPAFPTSLRREQIWGQTSTLHYNITLDRETATRWRVRWSVKRPTKGTLCPVNGACGGGSWKSWAANLKTEAAARAFIATKLEALRAAALRPATVDA